MKQQNPMNTAFIKANYELNDVGWRAYIIMFPQF